MASVLVGLINALCTPGIVVSQVVCARRTNQHVQCQLQDCICGEGSNLGRRCWCGSCRTGASPPAAAVFVRGRRAPAAGQRRARGGGCLALSAALLQLLLAQLGSVEVAAWMEEHCCLWRGFCTQAHISTILRVGCLSGLGCCSQAPRPYPQRGPLYFELPPWQSSGAACLYSCIQRSASIWHRCNAVQSILWLWQ